MSRVVAFLSGIICGGVAGITLAFLSAPKSGEETRRDLVESSDQLYRKAAYELEEIAELIQDVRHKADVIEANASINATPVIHDAQDAMRDATSTTVQSQQVLLDTQAPRRAIS